MEMILSRYRAMCIGILAATSLLAGCATQGIQQGAEFAKAGSDYSDAVIAFLDVYITTRIDVNSKRALEVRKTKLDAQLNDELPATLATFDGLVITAVGETSKLRDNVRLLNAEFESRRANLKWATGKLQDDLAQLTDTVEYITAAASAIGIVTDIVSVIK